MNRADALHGTDEQRWSQLMAAAHRGDKRQYEQLLRELAVAIERYITRRFGALAFVDDCVQECLLAIHAARHTYDPRRHFRPWVFTIVHNKTIDLLRRSHYRSQSGEDWLRLSFADGAVGADPADELAAGEVLMQIDPSYRDALTLTKIDGYSLAEAAARAGVTESAMKSRVARGIRAAAALLDKGRDRE
ncbi:MAG: sigma-70 family RNA polymerase sigma factor [Gammaproteobacteria bacterium]|nr:sigma-70 family RNA polymerase sigma factor [Gammaproteobacteria bacterium]